ncbi:DUF2568 domain-containing protein [Agrococcus sp. ARC_14]|uniref:DUF2568 domain-containing protein n=1 Tax=Agrococcus sp. ARC_14 TaxID=2919927 RepID=UPI001F0613A9|nr:DUF2568 domain-containing protein [Agrococcus sp. ARC_14]
MRGPAVLFILAALVVVEFIAWLILAMWGWTIGSQWGDTAGAIGTIVAFALVVLAWSQLASRRAKVPTPVKWVAKVLILGGAALTLASTDQVAAAVALAVVTAILVLVCETKPVRETLDVLAEPRERGR